MSGITALSSASLAPTHLPSASGAKAAKSSALTSGGSGGTRASASGDTTSITTNANGSLSVTVTNAKGQIVSTSTLQAGGANPANQTSQSGQSNLLNSPLNMLV